MSDLSQVQREWFGPGVWGLLTPIQGLFDDESISEILINHPFEVFYEKNGSLLSKEVPQFNEKHCYQLFQLIANDSEQIFNEESPLLSASLPDGSRVQLVLPPTSVYPTLSIRRKVVKDFSLSDYEKSNFFDDIKPFSKTKDMNSLPEEEKELSELYKKNNWTSFIKKAIEFKKNVVISGGTSSGKTTFLNACLREIPLEQRIIILEDTREIDIPHRNKVQLLASKGGQSKSKVSMQDLVQCCLRLRPDRIICGEIRGKEILEFLAASSTGHEGSITSIHANNPHIAFMRMTQMYKLNNVPSMSDKDIMSELLEVIDVIVQISKTPEGRKIQSIYYKYGDLVSSNMENVAC